MELKLLRYGQCAESTGGALSVDGVFICHTTEDEKRDVKVYGETRIPAGRYEIKLRTEGGMHEKYSARFPWHRGMLWLQDVPNFEWIYLHPGKNEKQTDGCILVGYTALSLGGFELDRPIPAYSELCRLVYSAIFSGEKVFITVEDL